MEQDKIEYKQLEMQLMDTSTYVYKSHNIIESGYNFTLNEQRLTYLATKKLKPKFIKSNLKPSQLTTYLGNETFKNIRIYVNEFKDEFELSSNNMYKVLEDTTASLKRKMIQYMQDDGTFVEKSWVITAKYNKEGKYVELTFHPDLILDLLVFKTKFSRLQFGATKTFKTSYAFRIYELLQNYAYKGVREITVEDLRYKLGIYEDDKYKKFAEFNRGVLEPSVESINCSTELNISYETKRIGRKVGKIIFYIKRQPNICALDDSDNFIEQSQVENINKITGKEFTAGQVSQITTHILESIKRNKINMSFYEYLEYEVEVLKQYNETADIKNYYGTLCTAIKEYWKLNIIEEKTKTTKFNNFDPRDKDYDELERQLSNRFE